MGHIIGKVCFKKGKTQIKSSTPPSFFDLQAKDIDGNLINFSQFRGKKAFMIVNVACKCGLAANNYKEMVELNNELESRGLQILAFPSSEFLNQQFKTEAEIKAYVKRHFNANFLIFEKTEINGEHPHPVYAYLRTHSQLYEPKSNKAKVIPWNFAKFILNRNGQVIKFVSPDVSPQQLKPIILAELAK